MVCIFIYLHLPYKFTFHVGNIQCPWILLWRGECGPFQIDSLDRFAHQAYQLDHDVDPRAPPPHRILIGVFFWSCIQAGEIWQVSQKSSMLFFVVSL